MKVNNNANLDRQLYFIRLRERYAGRTNVTPPANVDESFVFQS